jgi:hypothetical protein
MTTATEGGIADLFNAGAVGHIVVERAGFVLLNPDSDQVARDVMPFRQAMQRLSTREFLGDLAPELDAAGLVFRHGLPSFESPAPRSIHRRRPVRPQGATPYHNNIILTVRMPF